MSTKAVISLSVLLGLCAFVATSLPVQAASTAAVDATVTVQNVSVSLTDAVVTYGTIAVNTSKGTRSGDLGDTQTAQNDSNVTVQLNIRGANTAAWTLAGSAGADQYVHRFCIATCGTPVTNYTALTTSYQTLNASVASSATQTFDLYLTTPTSSSSFSQQSVDVTVQAVAP
jgi:hypothetical protein